MKNLAVLSHINRIRALKRRPLASLSAAESVAKRSRIICSNSPLYLGKQIMPFSVAVNERKSASDYYDTYDE